MSGLIDFLRRFSVNHSQNDRKHGRSGWVQTDCPRCGSTGFHCGIRLDLSRASCYKCGHWRVGELLKELSGASWSEVNTLVKQGRWVMRDWDAQPATGKYVPPTDLRDIDGTIAEEYLMWRNIHPIYASSVWGCQYVGPFSNYPLRLFIPINYRKKPVSWTARALVPNQEPRYQTAKSEQKAMDEKSILFGMDFAKSEIIIVEGPLDAIRIGAGAVATMGVAYTVAQLNLMSRYHRRIICLDNDKAGRARSERLAGALSVFPGETIQVQLDAPDPGSAKKSELEKLRHLAFGTVCTQ